MAGDFNKPTTASLYTAFPTEIRDMFADMAKQFDGTSTTNYPTNTIRWNNVNGCWEKFNGSTWAALIAKYLINVDKVDGYDAGNGSGNVPVSNGTVNTNLNADLLDGYNAGNANGNVPVSNGTVNTNLNADKLDGYDAGNASGNVPISNGTRSVNLNADLLDGYEATAFALVNGNPTFASVTVNGLVSAAGEIKSTTGVLRATGYGGNANQGLVVFDNTASAYIYFNGSYFYFTNTVYAPAFQINSRRELKQEIVPMADGALSEVMAWSVYEYEYKANPGVRTRGMMVDEINSIIADDNGINISAQLNTLAKAFQEYVRAHP